MFQKCGGNVRIRSSPILSPFATRRSLSCGTPHAALPDKTVLLHFSTLRSGSEKLEIANFGLVARGSRVKLCF
jgi:hypothetical protein